MTSKTYHGSCHCGAVKFTVDIDLAKGTTRCNCSICTKARAWFTAVKADEIILEQGEDRLADYTWTPSTKPRIGLHYRFCQICGIRVFATGEEKDLGGKFYAVAIAALDDVGEDVDQLAVSIAFVEGRHDQYGKGAPPPADTRLM